MALRKIEEIPSSTPESLPPRSDKDSFVKKILMVLVAVVLVYLTLYLGTLMRNNIKKYEYIGQAEQMERTIAVNGTGKVTAQNDVAMTTVGHSSVDKDVTKAQTENKKVMDPLFKDLKALGIEDKDLQSNYSINPEYNYSNDKGSQLVGYRVNNSVSIKIRDLSKISAVLNLTGKYGATEVGGLSFIVDDMEDLRGEARTKALEDAKSKARELAKTLGVTLGDIVSYNDYDSSPGPMYYGRDALMSEKAMNVGGGPSALASGSQEVTMNVTIVYKIISKRQYR